MQSTNRKSATAPDIEVAIIGAGFSGIGTAIALDKAGIPDYAILEAGDDYGGVWHWNTYPGVAVDIPSFSYQFSYEQRPDWSRSYAPGHELKSYAVHCADKYGLRGRTRFNTLIEEAAWDNATDCWRLRTAGGGEISARYLINGSGPLNVPKLPDIAGVESFAGATMHTARWDHSVQLDGKRIAVIGTGASAVQVIPEIAPVASQLTVFQRTPIWCFPKPDVPLAGALKAGMRLPGVKPLLRAASQAFVEVTFPLTAQYAGKLPLLPKQSAAFGKAWLRSQVKDPEVRAKLTPDYAIGCKRPSFHNGYLATFNRDNVLLETTPIAEITASGVRMKNGTLHEFDVIIHATGFKVAEGEGSYRIRGADGTTMGEFFAHNRSQSYQGITLPNFPNFFTIIGPYGYNGGSFFTLIEIQLQHILRCLKEARRRGATRVEVTADANRRYFEEMLARRHTQIFWQASCAKANSYYFDANGDVPLRRASTPQMIWEARHFPLTDYRFEGSATR
ncbi:MAG: flavin-containing monooxygenase [Gammaproteobacteria bacterium]